MKILQINKYFYQKGGAETVFFNTIDLLQENGHDVIPFALKHDKNKKSEYERFFVDYPELSESGLFTKVKNIPSFLYNRRAARQLERLILHEKPDVAHIHLMFNSLSVSILPLLKRYNIPVVMTVHDYRLICPAYTMTNGEGDICEKCLESHSYWHCVTDRCSKGSIMNSVLLSMDSYLRRFKYNPINYIDKFLFVSDFARNKHIQDNSDYENKSSRLYNFTLIKKETQKPKEDFLLYVGRLSHEKGLKTLVKAINGMSNVNLKIIGTGPLTDQLKALVKGGNVELLGFKQGEELKDYMQRAKFLLVPSEWYENNPMVAIEAMALGTPVIGSNIGGIPELIKEGKTGFLFEPKAVNDLRQTTLQALQMSIESYQVMCDLAEKEARAKFSKDVHYAKLIDAYNGVIAKNKARI